MKIVGIDLSLTGTGLASIVDGVPQTKAVVSKGEQADSLEQRFERQSYITNHILDFTLGYRVDGQRPEVPDLVVIENLFNSSTFAGSLIDRAGLWWRIVGSLLVWDVPVVHATPGQGKMFLTGAGNADKGAMAMYFSKIFPDWEPSTKKNANDEADAGSLASIGWALVTPPSAWPFEQTKYREKVVDDLRRKQNLVKEPA
jgi:crossover junction endodeoxyribonuclease RuvC